MVNEVTLVIIGIFVRSGNSSYNKTVVTVIGKMQSNTIVFKEYYDAIEKHYSTDS